VVASGVPVTRMAAILPPSYYPVMYLGRMSDGRTPGPVADGHLSSAGVPALSRMRLSAALG